jgi:O-antigen ligase
MAWLFLAGLVFTQWFNRAMFGVFFAELVLGGRGRIIEIRNTVPIRLAIGVFLVLAFLLGWFADGRASNFELKKSRACIMGAVMGTATFLFFGLFLGHVYGNSPDYIVAEARGFLFLAGGLPLLFFAIRRKADVNFVVGCFLAVVAFFGVAKSFGYSLVLAGIMSPKQLGAMIEQYIPQELGSGNISRLIPAPRLYMSGDFWMMFTLPLFVSLALAAKTRRAKVLLYGGIAVLFVGLVASETRGLWLAALLALAVVFWLSSLGSKVKIAVVLPFMLLGVLALSQDFLPSVQERMKMSLDFTEDSSNLGRISQFAPLMDMARKHIILGNGFGSYAHDHPGVDVQAPWSYELQPVSFLMKMGIVGCAAWGLFVGWLLLDLWRIYKRGGDPTHRVIAKGLLAGMLGLLFASATNPSFATSAGMGCLIFTVVMADMLRQPLPAAKQKENGISQRNRVQGSRMSFLRGAPVQMHR